MMTPGFKFEILAGDPAGARIGRLDTPHGAVQTPAFIPVATRGSVRGVAPDQLRALGTELLLANTYHLHIRPGEDVVAELGGLQQFCGWDGPMLTDSGGFQIMSLAELRKIDEDGVTFRSHIDGAPVRLTPESVLDIQGQLGTDIAMVLDDCAPARDDREALRTALERTVDWARRSIDHRRGLRTRSPMAVFAIGQGGPYEDFRDECAERLAELPFDGFAVGGVSVGEDRQQLLQTIPWGTRRLPRDRPRYLMGVAGPQEFVHAIEAGVDLFDCVMPTRNARNGTLFRWGPGEPVRLRNSRYARDAGPLDPHCDCSTCGRYSRGFLHHLFQRKELLVYTLLSIHNLRIFHRFLEEARSAIENGAWEPFASPWR